MQSPSNKLLTAALAALLIMAFADPSLARSKRSGSSTSDLGLQVDSSGTPIIMKGYRPSRSTVTPAESVRSDRQASRPVPRGSSSYVAPSRLPTTGPVTTGQAVQPYNPPPITTFSDRVNSAIQSYPLNRGIGNNPTDMQMYIRQNAN